MEKATMFYVDPQHENRILYYGWVVTGAGLIIMTVETGILLTFGVFFKPILAEFGWTKAQLSSVFSAFMSVRIVASLPVGYLADRFGVRIVVLLGAVLASTSLFFTSTFRNLWELYLYYSILFSIGTSCAYIPVTSAVSRWFRRKRGLAIGIVVLGLGLGTLVMTPLTGLLISSYGWRKSYFVLGLMLFVVFVGCGVLLKQRPKSFHERENTDAACDTLIISEDDSYNLRQAIYTSAFWTQGATWFFLSFALYSVLIHIVSYAINLGVQPIKASAILGMIGGCSLLGRVIMGSISDKLGRRRSTVISSLMNLAALTGMLVSSDLLMFYGSCFVFGFSYGGWGAQMPAMCADHFGEKNSGSILGGIFLLGQAGMAIGPWSVAYMIDLMGSYKPLFLATVGASLLGFLFSLLIEPPDKKRHLKSS
jgi:MFS family permease